MKWLLALSLCLLAGCGGASRKAAAEGDDCQQICSHYESCGGEEDASVCASECRFIFSQRRNLEYLESMKCADLVEFVDGSQGAPAH